jgi:hydrogenase/urease accessory protein HupE
VKKSFLLALAVCLLARGVAAHSIGLSTGEYRRSAEGLAVDLVFAQGELSSFAQEDIVRKIRVAAGAADCVGELVGSSPTDRDGVRLRASYRCADPGSRLVVRLDLLEDLPHGHRHSARVVSGEAVSDELCFKRHAELDVPGLRTPPGERRVSTTPALGFLRMGFEHILSGYDHLLFLFALVLVGARLRSLLSVVTAFTVAHSLTLALAVLGIFSPSPRIVEPAIALSIAYVGVENLVRRDFGRRWRITLPFGLIHGFGFAGALAEAGLARADVPVALVMFNLGVELGQLAVLVVLLPIVWRLGRWDGFHRRMVPALSFCVVLAGAVWFVDRAIEFKLPAESSITAGR